jgi:hypothetical protein
MTQKYIFPCFKLELTIGLQVLDEQAYSGEKHSIRKWHYPKLMFKHL